METSAGNHLIFQFRKSRLLELEIETLKEQNYMLTEKLSHLINMTIGSFHILDGALGRNIGAREHLSQNHECSYKLNLDVKA